MSAKRRTDWVTDILATVITLGIAAFVLMLCLGAAHSSDGRVPDLGFTTCLWLCVPVTSIAAIARRH